jgi:hypothetical protein
MTPQPHPLACPCPSCPQPEQPILPFTRRVAERLEAEGYEVTGERPVWVSPKHGEPEGGVFR